MLKAIKISLRKLRVGSLVSLLLVPTLFVLPMQAMCESAVKEKSAQHSSISKTAKGKTWAFKLTNEKTGLEFNLLGTGHAIPFSKLPPTVQNLVNNTQVLLGEIPNSDGFSAYTKKFGYDSAKAFYQLDPSMRHKIEKALKPAIQEDRLGPLAEMKPWMIYIQVIKVVEGQKYITGMDLEIMDIVGKKNKGMVIPLETMAERIEAMGIRKMTIDQCEETLAGLFQPNRKQGEKAVDRAYLTDLESLHRIMRPAISSPEMVGILKNRNDLWLKKLPTILNSVKAKANEFENSTPLVAVGAGHLLGKDGLLMRLSKMGYSVQRYCQNGDLIPYKPLL